MATVARTSAFPQSVTLRGIHMIIGWNFTQRPAVGEQIFNMYSSSQYREHTLTMGGSGLFDEKTEGTAIEYTSLNEGFLTTFTHADYSKGFRVTRRMYINDMYDSMEEHGAELGRMALATKETVLASHLNNGFSGSYLGADGKALFATDHVREDGVAYRNKPASGSDADLSATALEQGLIDFRDQRDGGGKRIQVRPRKLIVAASGVFDGVRLLGSTHDPETDKNAVNPLEGLGLSQVTWDYLSDSDAWFIAAEKDEHKLLCYDREDLWTEHEYDFDTKDVKFSGMMTFSSGWGDPRGLWGTSGS